jgi:hypothetical protein
MSEAPVSLEKRMVDARRVGRETAAAGLPRDNPHRPTADTAVERTLSLMWARGYSEGNPVVLDLAEA